MCAQIERDPRQGVELYETCGAPSIRELLLCDLVTLALVGLAAFVVLRFA